MNRAIIKRLSIRLASLVLAALLLAAPESRHGQAAGVPQLASPAKAELLPPGGALGPASMLLAGGALIAFGVVGRKRRR